MDTGDRQTDSFDQHLNRLIVEKSVKTIQEFRQYPKLKKNIEISEIKWPKLGSLSFLKPMIDENKDSVIKLLAQDQIDVIKTKTSSNQHKLNDFQLELYSLLASYKDLIYTNESIDNQNDIQTVYVLHVLNHLMSSRMRIINNNKIFEKKVLSDNIIHDNPKLRDQGYTRAKILFLLPFRYSALKLGKSIVKILGDEYSVTHMDRFIKEFGDEDGVDSVLRPVESGKKSRDYYQTFHGNTDDAFRIGLKLTKKNIKFFADFYDSDIIIASPLGIKTIIAPEESQAVAASDNEQVPAGSYKDFLSSIEIIILDQADIFLMQNWEHVLDIMQHINLMPSKPRKMDISRVRQWHLENWSKYYRQLIVFASISVPLIHSFFQTYSLNYEGFLTFKHRVDNPQARQVVSKCKQQFLYYESTNAKDACDDRYKYFIKHVLPKFTEKDETGKPIGHTLIFVSSYFDYVRLRNHFRREQDSGDPEKKETLSFTQICEYTEANNVSKARQLFNKDCRRFLLYTERCHFYHRYQIKGIRRVIFYEPPLYAKFYTEIVNMLTPEMQHRNFVETSSSSFIATTLFSNQDTLQLGAIIGYSNAVRLIQNKKSIM